jgi:hypothetical protein
MPEKIPQLKLVGALAAQSSTNFSSAEIFDIENIKKNAESKNSKVSEKNIFLSLIFPSFI